MITIESFAFGGVASVAAGGTVTVTNNDTVPHTVTADDDSFDTGTIQPGDSAVITVDAAGTFAFHCNFHSQHERQHHRHGLTVRPPVHPTDPPCRSTLPNTNPRRNQPARCGGRAPAAVGVSDHGPTAHDRSHHRPVRSE